MKLNNKGQGAMEYLMTYGWAILVVMIVGVVLWQLGIFGGAGSGVNRGVDFVAIKPFDNSIVLSDSADTLTAVFTNAGGTALKITAVEVSGVNCGTSCGAAADDTTPFVGGAASTTLSLSPGETIQFSVPADLLAEDDSFVAEITIKYDQNIGGQPVSKIEKGKLTGTVAA